MALKMAKPVLGLPAPPLVVGAASPRLALRHARMREAEGRQPLVSTVKRGASNQARPATLSAGGCNPSFDSLRFWDHQERLGDTETANFPRASGRASPPEHRGGGACYEVKVGDVQANPRDVPKGRDVCQTRGLLRRWVTAQDVKGKPCDVGTQGNLGSLDSLTV